MPSSTQSPQHAIFGTKSETLEHLRALVQTCTVLDLQHFTVARWEAEPATILAELRRRFGAIRLVVRSSARGEDSPASSMAGAFCTCLDVDGSQEEAIRLAIDKVVASYHGNPGDQVLVQPMLTDVTMSGVIMTRELNTGGPYYVINYDDESGRTDKITGGHGVNKTVVVHRNFQPGYIESPRLADVLARTQELEGIYGAHTPLDIEFAYTRDHRFHVLQVRPISSQASWSEAIDSRVSVTLSQLEEFFVQRGRPRPGLAGARTILGQMPDWNPAEMIGTHPRPLAVSLYRTLITDSVWREARLSMGYANPGPEALMVMLAGHPYIDVRNSFNSFLPAELDPVIANRVVDGWLDYLSTHPHWHDKVEFEVAQTVYDFNFEAVFAERFGGLLNRQQFDSYKTSLQRLTCTNVSLDEGGSLKVALGRIRQLVEIQTVRADCLLDLSSVPTLLDECIEQGTRPFAVIARHAFMAEALLRSAVLRGALTQTRYEAFKQAIVTVTGQFAHAFEQVLQGEGSAAAFLQHYGHLRPGTYDIRSLRYDQRPELFSRAVTSGRPARSEGFVLTAAERHDLDILLVEAGLGKIDAEQFLAYARLAIAGREEGKFVFTRHLSDMVEILAHWGEGRGLDRDAVSYLSLGRVLDQLVCFGPRTCVEELAEEIQRGRNFDEVTSAVRLFYLLRDIPDIHVAPQHRSAPTFITHARVEGAIGIVDTMDLGVADLRGVIVCIENADPGYDWIFTRGIAGLLTKFGGGNSHMAIRCAELALPAAIGVGEQTFARVLACGKVEIDCGDKVVRPVHG